MPATLRRIQSFPLILVLLRPLSPDVYPPPPGSPTSSLEIHWPTDTRPILCPAIRGLHTIHINVLFEAWPCGTVLTAPLTTRVLTIASAAWRTPPTGTSLREVQHVPDSPAPPPHRPAHPFLAIELPRKRRQGLQPIRQPIRTRNNIYFAAPTPQHTPGTAFRRLLGCADSS